MLFPLGEQSHQVCAAHSLHRQGAADETAVRHSSACSKKNETPLCFCEAHRPHMTANSIRLTMSREMRKPIRPTIRNKAGKRVRLNVM